MTAFAPARPSPRTDGPWRNSASGRGPRSGCATSARAMCAAREALLDAASARRASPRPASGCAKAGCAAEGLSFVATAAPTSSARCGSGTSRPVTAPSLLLGPLAVDRGASFGRHRPGADRARAAPGQKARAREHHPGRRRALLRAVRLQPRARRGPALPGPGRCRALSRPRTRRRARLRARGGSSARAGRARTRGFASRLTITPCAPPGASAWRRDPCRAHLTLIPARDRTVGSAGSRRHAGRA